MFVLIEKWQLQQLLCTPSLLPIHKYMTYEVLYFLGVDSQLSLQLLHLLTIVLCWTLCVLCVTLMSLAHLSLYFSPSNGCFPTNIS